MNVPAASGQDIFDVRKIRRLVELMKEHDLSEIDLQQGEVRIQLRRRVRQLQPLVAPLRRRGMFRFRAGRSACRRIGRAAARGKPRRRHIASSRARW